MPHVTTRSPVSRVLARGRAARRRGRGGALPRPGERVAVVGCGTSLVHGPGVRRRCARRAGTARPTRSPPPRSSSTAATTRSSRSPARAPPPRCSSSSTACRRGADRRDHRRPGAPLVGRGRRRRSRCRSPTSARSCRPASPPPRSRSCAPPRRGPRRGVGRRGGARGPPPPRRRAPTHAHLPRARLDGRARRTRRRSSCARPRWRGPRRTRPWSTATARSRSPTPAALVWLLGDAPGGLAADVAATGAPVVAARTATRWPSSCASSGSPSRWPRARGLDPDRPRNLTRSVILEGRSPMTAAAVRARPRRRRHDAQVRPGRRAARHAARPPPPGPRRRRRAEAASTASLGALDAAAPPASCGPRARRRRPRGARARRRGVAGSRSSLGEPRLARRAAARARRGARPACRWRSGTTCAPARLAEAGSAPRAPCGDVVVLVIGTGIAGPLVLDGRPYAGGGFAGEIGTSSSSPAAALRLRRPRLPRDRSPRRARSPPGTRPGARRRAARSRPRDGRARAPRRAATPSRRRSWDRAPSRRSRGGARATYVSAARPARLIVVGGGLAGRARRCSSPLDAALGARLTLPPAPRSSCAPRSATTPGASAPPLLRAGAARAGREVAA